MKLLSITLLAFIFSVKSFACVQVNNNEFCNGQLVVNDSGLKGQIQELLTRNRAYVLYPSFEIEVEVKLETLGVLKGSSDGFSVGDQIMTAYGEYGTISGTFADGKLAVQVKDFWQLQVLAPKKIARIVGCTEDGFCAGDQIVNKYGKEGDIIAYFPGQLKVLVAFPNQDRLFTWKTKDLSH